MPIEAELNGQNRDVVVITAYSGANNLESSMVWVVTIIVVGFYQSHCQTVHVAAVD